MKSESIKYPVGSLACRGELIYDETAKGQPLLLMAPNWLGVTKDNVAVGQTYLLASLKAWTTPSGSFNRSKRETWVTMGRARSMPNSSQTF